MSENGKVAPGAWLPILETGDPPPQTWVTCGELGVTAPEQWGALGSALPPYSHVDFLLGLIA